MKGLYCTHSFLPFSLTIIGSRSQGVQGLGIDNTSQGAFSCVTCTCIIIVPPVHAHLGGGKGISHYCALHVQYTKKKFAPK